MSMSTQRLHDHPTHTRALTVVILSALSTQHFTRSCCKGLSCYRTRATPTGMLSLFRFLVVGMGIFCLGTAWAKDAPTRPVTVSFEAIPGMPVGGEIHRVAWIPVGNDKVLLLWKHTMLRQTESQTVEAQTLYSTLWSGLAWEATQALATATKKVTTLGENIRNEAFQNVQHVPTDHGVLVVWGQRDVAEEKHTTVQSAFWEGTQWLPTQRIAPLQQREPYQLRLLAAGNDVVHAVWAQKAEHPEGNDYLDKWVVATWKQQQWSAPTAMPGQPRGAILKSWGMERNAHGWVWAQHLAPSESPITIHAAQCNQRECRFTTASIPNLDGPRLGTQRWVDESIYHTPKGLILAWVIRTQNETDPTDLDSVLYSVYAAALQEGVWSPIKTLYQGRGMTSVSISTGYQTNGAEPVFIAWKAEKTVQRGMHFTMKDPMKLHVVGWIDNTWTEAFEATSSLCEGHITGPFLHTDAAGTTLMVWQQGDSLYTRSFRKNRWGNLQTLATGAQGSLQKTTLLALPHQSVRLIWEVGSAEKSQLWMRQWKKDTWTPASLVFEAQGHHPIQEVHSFSQKQSGVTYWTSLPEKQDTARELPWPLYAVVWHQKNTDVQKISEQGDSVLLNKAHGVDFSASPLITWTSLNPRVSMLARWDGKNWKTWNVEALQAGFQWVSGNYTDVPSTEVPFYSTTTATLLLVQYEQKGLGSLVLRSPVSIQ